MTIPSAKVFSTSLPNIRSIPSIPFVGSAGGSATTYIGEQFGNLPDISTVLHIRTVKKALLEQIYALIQGELPQPPRAPIYAARAAQLAQELVEVASFLGQMVAGITAEANATIASINETVGEITAAKAAIESIASGSRDSVQQLMLEGYAHCLSELNAQAERIQATIDSVTS